MEHTTGTPPLVDARAVVKLAVDKGAACVILGNGRLSGIPESRRADEPIRKYLQQDVLGLVEAN